VKTEMQGLIDTDDPYETLGVSYEMSIDEIHKTWKSMVVQLHPDKNRDDPDAPEKLADINAAWNQIKKPEDREFYDAWFTIMYSIKKVTKWLRRSNKPVILAAKMMGMPAPEENYLEFVYLQYAWGFIFALIGQIIPIGMWVYLVPGFMKKIFGLIWYVVTFPLMVCWWGTKLSWRISLPGLKALFVVYNAWVMFPRVEFQDSEYEIRLLAFFLMHYLLFVETKHLGLCVIKWAVWVLLEGWLIGSESKAVGSNDGWLVRIYVSHLFPAMTVMDATK
jgi:hypothetical protein